MAATDVIVGLDDSNSAAEALSWATHYARLNQLRLLAVHVSPFLADLPPDWAPENPAYDPRTDDELGPIAVRSRASLRSHPSRTGVGLARRRRTTRTGARRDRPRLRDCWPSAPASTPESAGCWPVR